MANDFLEDENGDLLIDDGDLGTGDAEQTLIEDTIIAHPGWWMEFPADGVGIMDYGKSTGQEQVLARKIKLQLENDGYQVDNPQVIFIQDKLTVNPNAIRI